MTDKPDLTERQAQVLWALTGEKLAADIDPTETGGLADDGLAEHLGVSEETARRTPDHRAAHPPGPTPPATPTTPPARSRPTKSPARLQF